MRQRNAHASSAVLLAAMAVLVGCGSTAQTGAPAAGTAGGLAVAPTPAALAGGLSPTTSNPPSAPGSPLVVGAPAGSPGAGEPAGTVPTAGPVATAAPVAPGGAIEIGIPYLDSSQTNAFTGGVGKNLQNVDTKAVYQAVITKVNAAGGILGRKIVPVYLSLSVNATVAQLAQQTCTYFTQDHKVLV